MFQRYRAIDTDIRGSTQFYWPQFPNELNRNICPAARRNILDLLCGRGKEGPSLQISIIPGIRAKSPGSLAVVWEGAKPVAKGLAQTPLSPPSLIWPARGGLRSCNLRQLPPLSPLMVTIWTGGDHILSSYPQLRSDGQWSGVRTLTVTGHAHLACSITSTVKEGMVPRRTCRQAHQDLFSHLSVKFEFG